MFFIDVSTGMATLKSGGASAIVPQGTTKLILPHEMLTANGTAQSVIGASASPLSSGHSTTTTLLLSNNHHFYHATTPAAATTTTFHNSSSLFNTNSNSSSNGNSNTSHDLSSSSSPHHLIHISNHHRITNNQPTAVSLTASSQPSGAIFVHQQPTNQNYALLVGGNSIAATSNISSATNAASSTTTTTTATMNKLNTTADDTTTTTTTQPPATETADETEETTEEMPVETVTEPAEEDPEIDIVINNVVCSFSVRCHLNLRNIALNGHNVEFRRENGMVTMKLRKPYTTASIWSSGKITCTGATSEDNAKVAARRYARMLQKLGFRVRFNNFRVVNVLGTCSMPWAIKITHFSEKYRKEASYEPELHPGVTYKLKEPKATLKIFSTGSITVTAASVSFVQQAIEHIYPLVYEFRKKRTPDEEKTVKAHLLHPEPTFDPNDLIEVDEDFDEEGGGGDNLESTSMQPPKKRRRRPAGKAVNDPDEDIMQVSDVEKDLDDSDDDL